MAAVAGWVEGLKEKIASGILKSNLISFYFPKEGVEYLRKNITFLPEIMIERENKALQIEYVYVDSEHRGIGLAQQLIKTHIANAIEIYPDMKKVQVQLFANNEAANKLYSKLGFINKEYFKSENQEIFNYLPYNTTLLMELNIR